MCRIYWLQSALFWDNLELILATNEEVTTPDLGWRCTLELGGLVRQGRGARQNQ